MEADELRARLGAGPPIGFERITTAEAPARDWAPQAAAVVAGAWEWKGRGPVDVRPSLDWRAACAPDRSRQVALHAWEPLAPVLATIDRGDAELLPFALAFALDWWASCGSWDAADDLAWYDQATGLRAYRLAYLLDHAVRAGEVSAETVGALLAALDRHRRVLADDARFAAHSNHGLFQVAGQLAMARRFWFLDGMADTRRLALDRLRLIADHHFTAEGMHREHSPHYHRMVASIFDAMLRSGLVAEAWFEERQRGIQDALAWLVLPDQHLAMLGDTHHASVATRHVEAIASPSYRFVASGGGSGRPPDDVVAVFKQSGYAILRDRWPASSAEFRRTAAVIHACAFHSQVHKHADDQTVLWFDRGAELLADAGRYGYVGRTENGSALRARGFWYDDPQRIHVESTRAHNTVEIDGRSYDRSRRPYRSGILGAGAAGALRWSHGRVEHGDVTHDRVLAWKPGDWLLVLDLLGSDSGVAHEYTQRFHFAPDVGRVDGLRFSLPDGGGPLAVASLTGDSALEPVRGQREPELLGWISRRDRELVPRWSFGFRSPPAAHAAMAALFCFTAATIRPLRVELSGDGGTIAADLAWMAGSGRGGVRIAASGRHATVREVQPAISGTPS